MDKHQNINKERTEGKENFQVKLALVNSSKWGIRKQNYLDGTLRVAAYRVH